MFNIIIEKSFWFIVTMMFIIVSCKKESINYTHLKGNAQGTTFSIKYASSGDKNYSSQIDSIFKVIDLSLSSYLENSLISKINNGDTAVVLDEHFAKVFNQSLLIFKETNGVFDPSVSTLVKAYGFENSKSKASNIEENLDSLMQFVGFDLVSIQNQKIVKQNTNVKLDFNAIAQGYTVDVIADFLKNQNIQNFMIEIGGEVKATGVNEKGKLWTVGIQSPNPDKSDKLETVINLNNMSVATSGNYRKFKTDENGKKYVHIINPKTGKAEAGNILSASVIHPRDCAYADAYATAFMVMGFEKTQLFLKNHPELNVYIIYLDENNATRIFSNIDD